MRTRWIHPYGRAPMQVPVYPYEGPMRDDIRPKGTVMVQCSHPDCLPKPGEDAGPWSFWVDALDPRLPDGPFICPAHDGGGPTQKAES